MTIEHVAFAPRSREANASFPMILILTLNIGVNLSNLDSMAKVVLYYPAIKKKKNVSYFDVVGTDLLNKKFIRFLKPM